MPSKHPWKFVFGIVDTTCTIGTTSPQSSDLIHEGVMGILKKEYLQDLLTSIGYFEDAKFTWVGLIIRYGPLYRNEGKTHFQGLDKKYECIDLAREVDKRVFLIADRHDVEMLMDFFKITALDSLIDAGKKYKLKESAIEILKKEREKLGQIPDWIPEMEDNPQLVVDMYKASVPK
jgi:hypothetical protein